MNNSSFNFIPAIGNFDDFDNFFITRDSYKPNQSDTFFSEFSEFSQVSAHQTTEQNFLDIDAQSATPIN